jgi:hypothetical protein
MSVLGLFFGYAIARGRPDASRIALVSALPRSPVLGLVLASALVRNETPAAPALAMPIAPVLTARASSPNQINLSWTATPGASAYNILRGPQINPGHLIAENWNRLTYSDLGLRPNTQYHYVIQALDANGNAIASSNEAQAQTAAWLENQERGV